MVDLGLKAGQFLFNFENVRDLGGFGEEAAEPGAQGGLVFELGGEVAVLGGDIVARNVLVGDFSCGFQCSEEGLEVGGMNFNGGIVAILAHGRGMEVAMVGFYERD